MDNLTDKTGNLEADKCSLVHINMIPNELLIMVFIRLRKVNTEDNAGFRCWLFSLMHTCQHWRKVASESSQCWTQLDYFASRDIVKMFLERSNKAELSIKLNRLPGNDESDVESNKYFGFAVEDGSRIKELSVTDYPESEATWNPIVELIGKSAPALRRVYLASPYIMFLSAAEPKLVLPSLTPEALPALRHVSLSDMCLRWNTSRFCNLTSFRLKSLRLRYQPSLSQILDILEDSPLLEYLDLDHTAPSELTAFTTRSKPVVMSNLRTLKLSNMSYPLFLEFMNHLKFDCRLSWTVSCTGYQIDQTSIPLNRSLIQNTDVPDITRISVSPRYLSISGYINYIEISHIVFQFFRDFDKPHQIFKRVVEYIRNTSWSQAKRVHIDAEVDAPKDADNVATWIHLLEAIPNASHLVVDFLSESCDEFPDAFATALERTDKPNDSNATPFLLPLLTDVILRHVDFSEDSSSFDAFLKCIKTRNEHNLRLRRLVIASSFGYSQDRIKVLSEHVDNLFWDEAYIKFMGEICKSRKEYKLRKEEHSRANPNPLVIDVLTPFHGY